MNTIASSVVSGIHVELEWIRSVFLTRLKAYFEKAPVEVNVDEGAPELSHLPAVYRDIIESYEAGPTERIVLGLTLAPHVDPGFITGILEAGVPANGDFPVLGCVRGKNHRGFLPTGETALFVIAGTDPGRRIETQALFTSEHWLFRKQYITLEEMRNGEPMWSGRLIANDEFVELILTGKLSKPVLSADFPAKYISTEVEWDDLVLSDQVLEQIHELELWLNHHQVFMRNWGMSKKVRPGYRVLFHGPPGTGKTLTATLLGKYTGLHVFKVDLSLVVSKYIGETEKNLSMLFTKAENKNWILFFDEADALFGKRTEQRDAHDRHANQEVAYLLQRVEDYPGLVILASNYRTNIDPAFTRRFQSMIHFPFPKKEERLRLWRKAFPAQVRLSPEIRLEEIAAQYEISGANIMHVVQYCCLHAIADGSNAVSLKVLEKGIRREYEKEDRIV